jgi:hypothetical protein
MDKHYLGGEDKKNDTREYNTAENYLIVNFSPHTYAFDVNLVFVI